jgi:magnesium transporter
VDEKYSLVSYRPRSVDFYNSATLDDILEKVEKERVSYVIVRSCVAEDRPAVETLLSFFEADPDLANKILGDVPREFSDEALTSLFVKYQVPTSAFDLYQNAYVEKRGSFLAGEGYVLHFLEDDVDFSNVIHNRLQVGKTQAVEYGSDYLLYLLMRTATGQFENLIDVSLKNRFEELEDYIIANPAEDDTMDRLLAEREHVKALYEPLRRFEMFLDSVREGDFPFITEETSQRFSQNLVSDFESLEKGYLRLLDWWSELLELHRTNVSESTDDIMNMLTIISTIFLPITFLTGVFGMNFIEMPGLENPHGFYILMLVMLVITGITVLYMNRKGWFS